ncbi:MAG: hypothetical protein HRT82_06885 [Henriciella sp.]|nr:hypothetical protein [Henriciella sp.]
MLFHKYKMISSAILGLALLSAFAIAAPAAEAKTCYGVSKIKYTNKGAYTLGTIFVMFKDQNGNKHETVGIRSNVLNGQSATVNISAVSDGPSVGDEVWGKIKIEAGDRNGCRKDGNKFYYDKQGGTVSYKSSGTTQNDNRCELNRRPNEKYIIDCP